MTEIWAVLRPLERIETLMGEIYQTLAERHAGDPDAARLFGRLVVEERSHLTQVRYVQRMARQTQQAFGDVAVDLEGVRRTLEDLETLAGVASGLGLAEAVPLLLHLEGSAAEAHGRAALADAAGEMGALLRGLAQGDAKHARALAEFAAARGLDGAGGTGTTGGR